MPLSFAAALLIAQVGPFGATPLPVTPQMDRANAGVPQRVPGLPAVPAVRRAAASRLGECLDAADADPGGAVGLALAWQGEVRGSVLAEPGQCLGVAYSRTGRWAEAEQSFLAARDAAAASDYELRARLGAMAGNAALAAGAAPRALAALDAAHDQARAAGDSRMAGDIAIDRARALVALGRSGEAAMALDEARTASPDNGLGWLLSATLARREGQLALAQQRIEVAARLAPSDPEVGLEAGVIAMLAGQEAAARRSWRAVAAMTPEGPATLQAKAYLAQIGPSDDAPAGR